MTNEKIQREKCLFETEDLMTSITGLLKSMCEDPSGRQLDPCTICKRGLSAEKCRDIHDYLQSVYENVTTLKNALGFIYNQ